jgi:enoyl-CoA hydratase/carnithine racemase
VRRAPSTSRVPRHGGAGIPIGDTLPDSLLDPIEYNPGGLAGVWAEENSRDAIYAALQRRETFATSGPRIAFRSFAGWQLDGEMCRGDFAKRGYAEGVPMGGELGPRPTADAAPVIAAWALQDPGTIYEAGVRLQRLQIIKLSVQGGEVKESVYDIAGNAGNRATVDPETCEPTPDRGSPQLCAVWRDNQFDPRAPTLYYARVVQNPTCRWSAYACNAAGIRCDDRARSGPATRRAATRPTRRRCRSARGPHRSGTRRRAPRPRPRKGAMADDFITLEYDGPVAVLSNNRPDKHNAANDAMDAQLFQALAELHRRDDVRAIVWRGNGKSFSSGRDTTQLGVRTEDISNLDFIERGHAGTQLFFSIPAPIIVALKGLGDRRLVRARAAVRPAHRGRERAHAAARDPARRRPRFGRHGAAVPDGRPRARRRSRADGPRARRAGGAAPRRRVARGTRRRPRRDLPAVAHEIAKMPAFTVKMFRRTLARLANPLVQASIQEEAITQVLTQASDDYAEFKAARAEKRDPTYRRR